MSGERAKWERFAAGSEVPSWAMRASSGRAIRFEIDVVVRRNPDGSITMRPLRSMPEGTAFMLVDGSGPTVIFGGATIRCDLTPLVDP